MANPVGFEGANLILKAPPGDNECRDLEAYRDDRGVTSCWRLTDEELKRVNETGVVWFWVQGPTHPPISVSGTALVHMHGKPSRAEPYIAPAKEAIMKKAKKRKTASKKQPYETMRSEINQMFIALGRPSKSTLERLTYGRNSHIENVDMRYYQDKKASPHWRLKDEDNRFATFYVSDSGIKWLIKRYDALREKGWI